MFYHYLTTFLFSLGVSFFSVPAAITLSRRLKILDNPNARKVHDSPVPRAGGLGMVGAFYAGLAAVWILFPSFSNFLDFNYDIYLGPNLLTVLSLKKQLCGVILGSLFITLVGLYDDKFSIAAKIKLPLQIIASCIAMFYGVRLFGITLPWDKKYLEFSLLAGQFVTVFWLTGFMNTINLVDGLDGLAAGICAIASGTFLVVAILQGQTEIIWFSKQLKLAGILSASLCGACLGFLWFNFNPAKVFMGDCGALFLGFILGSIMIIGTLKTTAFFSLIIPIVIVALPVLDVFLAIVRRLRSGQAVFDADRKHLHHRFLNYGWSHRETVLIIYLMSLLLAILSILLTVFKGKV